jgi:hypothetical protein
MLSIILFLTATTYSWAQTEAEKDPAPCCGVLLGTRTFGIGIGNVPSVKGIRLNFRDHGLKRVDGLNLSLWIPKENTGSIVQGFNLGLLPEAGTMKGVSVGLLGATGTKMHGIFGGLVGVGAVDEIKGLSIGGLGVASNKRLSGISIAGAAVAGRDHVHGISLSGIGIGSGGDISGIQIAGIGIGGGDGIRGLSIAGIGLGSEGSMEGISAAGIGIGSGGDIRGLALSGIGIGASETITGVSVSGIGTGAKQLKGIHLSGIGMGAQHMDGFHVAGVGLGAQTIKGFAMTGIALGGEDLQGFFVSPVLLAKELRGMSINPAFTTIYQNYGATLAAVNVVRCPGDQRWGDFAIQSCEAINHGVQIGIYNYSKRMGDRAWQIGLLNYVRDNRKGMRLLPLVNRRFE